jgi:hypothetical protein
MIPDTLITKPGRVARLCQNQRLLTKLADQIGEALMKGDWLAIEGLADQVVVVGNDLGLDAYEVDKVERGAR